MRRQQAMTDLLQQISDHIWLYPPNPDSEVMQPGVGIIITDSASVLIDAGNSPRHARQIRAALRQIDAPPVSYVIYTHHHWDHTFGAQIWTGSITVGHEQCRDLLLEHYDGQPWNQHHGLEQDYPNPAQRLLDRTAGDWGAFQLVLPQITFTASMKLIVGNLTLALRHVGGQHAADSIIVQAGEVLFIGDCIEPPPDPPQPPGDTAAHGLIDNLLRYEVNVFVDGHNGPAARADFARRREGE